MADTIWPGQIESSRSMNVGLVSSSVHKYVNYSKQMQVRLAELNDNVSNVIKDSCSGIDNICNRVRQCLFEMDQREKSMYLMDEVTEYEIIEESKSVEEFSQDNENIRDNTSSVEMLQRNEQSAIENVQTITPFFTVLNCQSKENSSKTECCRKQVLTKTIYSLLDKEESSLSLNEESETGINFENFKETVSTLCKNFDMMNKLVENINKEIEQFSQTALTSNERSLEVIDKKEESKDARILKPIKRLSKSNSRQKSIQVGDYLSENELDLEMMEWNNRDSESFIIPDVYRKRAFTNLYQRLVMQVEANDSLMFFQTLMKRQKKMEKKVSNNRVSQIKLNIPIMNYSVPQKSTTNGLNRRQSSKKLDLDKKYAGSLWFSQKHTVKEKSGSKNASKNASKKECVNKKSSKTIENKSEHGYALPERSKSRNRKSKVSDAVKSLKQTKKIPKFSSVADVTRQSCSLECTCRMVVQNDMPPSPSTKCQLQWLRAKPPHVAQRKIEFLNILDDLTTRDLLPLQSEYPRKDNQQPRELDYKDIQDTYLYKLLYGKQGTKNAWKQLIEPSIHCSKKNCSTCKPPRLNLKKSREEKIGASFMDKFCTQNYSKSEVLKKLSPYIFDPEKQEERCMSVIVMPVHVFYDNFKSNEPPTKLKSPNKQPVGNPKKNSVPPFREPKGSARKSDVSTAGSSKTVKVVYDSLQGKPQVSPTTTIVKSPVTQSNVPAVSARQNSEKKFLKNVRSRSFSPTSFASYQDVKKESTDSKGLENISAYSKLQAEFNKIRRDVYEKKFTQYDKKLWSSKYGKSVGQQLISYVQHQEPEATRPLPKHAMPKLKINSTLPEKRNIAGFLKEVNPHRQILSHVRNLRTNNDGIQDNIKKAIDVIEGQMVDILHNGSNSVEAFDIMEKEIMSVLNQMKCNGNKVLKTISSKSYTTKDKIESSPDINALEKDYKIISDQLFDRLQKILDTGGSSVPNTPPEGCAKRKHQSKKDKEETRKKQKLSSSKRNKIGALSSSTSASMDENIYVKRSPRCNPKKMENGDMKSKSTNMEEPACKDNWENVCGDLNIIKLLQETEDLINENPVKHELEDQAWNNSEGDFTNQDTNPFDDIETDNTYDVISDDKVEKLLTVEEIPQISDTDNCIKDIDVDQTIVEMEEFITEELNKAIEEAESQKSIINTEMEEFITEELNEAIEEAETQKSIINTEMEEFITEELNEAIEEAETQKSIINTDMEDFIIDELDKAIKEAETLTATSDSGLTRDTITIEMEEYLNEELDKAITEAETIVTSSEEAECNVTAELKEFINQELDEAIKKAETLIGVSNTSEITHEEKHIVTADIKTIKELDNALIRAESMTVIPSSLDVTTKHIFGEMEEVINEELNKALIKADCTAISTDIVHNSIINSEVRELITEELTNAITKAKTFTEIPNPVTNTDAHQKELNKALIKADCATICTDIVHNSITNSEVRELITEELANAITKAKTFTEIPNPVTNTDAHQSVHAIKEQIEEELNKAIQKAEELANFSDTIDDQEIGERNDENLNLLDSSSTTDEEICVEKLEIEGITRTQCLENENAKTKLQSPRHAPEPPKVFAELEGENEPSSPNLSDQIHKIIRRVEDIYSQLDDIQNSDSMAKIPVFKEVDIPDVHSEIFLTPFMHAVKETRKKFFETDKEPTIEKSPSYYNVMNFLDNLNNIQKEMPYEIHITRLLNYAYICHEAIIYYRVEIWHDTIYATSRSERSTCLKSVSEERKQITHKKVSFSQISKEDKSSQATLCPYHKTKAIKISSQQFPPVQQSHEEEKIVQAKTCRKEKSSQSNEIIEIKKASGHMYNSDASEIHTVLKHRCCMHKNRKPAHHEPDKKICQIHGDVGKMAQVQCKRKQCASLERSAAHGDCCAKTKKHQPPVIGDKATQVFCQMQKENSADRSAADEQPCVTLSNNEESTECLNYMEDNPDDSNSTDKDFLDNSLIDPFYDYVNESVNTQKIKEEDNGTGQARIVVFKEVVGDQDLLQPQEGVISSNEMEAYKKKLQRRRELRLTRKSNVEISRVGGDSENVVLLKSFYAIVYILMFTALSLDYRCL